MSTNDPLHYRKPEPTPDVMALAEAFERALRGRSGRIGWDGSYDHGDPPSVVQIVSSAIPALGQLGWKMVPVAHERSAGAAPDWGRIGYVLGLVGPVDMDDTEDAYVAYVEDIRAKYNRTDLEDDPQYAAYAARLSERTDR